jgi:hypothetical protein
MTATRQQLLGRQRERVVLDRVLDAVRRATRRRSVARDVRPAGTVTATKRGVRSARAGSPSGQTSRWCAEAELLPTAARASERPVPELHHFRNLDVGKTVVAIDVTYFPVSLGVGRSPPRDHLCRPRALAGVLAGRSRVRGRGAVEHVRRAARADHRVRDGAIDFAIPNMPGGHRLELVQYNALEDRRHVRARPSDVGSVDL